MARLVTKYPYTIVYERGPKTGPAYSYAESEITVEEMTQDELDGWLDYWGLKQSEVRIIFCGHCTQAGFRKS